MISRRAFIGSVAGGLLAAPLAAQAQPAGKVSRVGILWTNSPPPGASPNILLEVVEALRALGWVEGQNIVIEHRFAEGRPERFPDLAAELVRLKVDVILAGGGPASLNAASSATKTIPIVMVASSHDPIREGLIKSFARPGGNITGLIVAPEEIAGKRLELLKEVVPGLSRVGLLWDATLSSSFRSADEEAARSLRVELLRFEVREPTDLDSAVMAATKEQVGGLIVLGSPMLYRNRREIADLLARYRLPAISQWRQFAEAGILMTYGSSLPDQFRRAVYFVDKILRGAKPADLPVEQPTKFELVINLKTARALGLTIPQSLLLRADEVIQ